jgi:hypothetical protein
VHEEETPHNSQIARTKGAISLKTSGNLQGGFKFMDLNTGKKFLRCSWYVFPMPGVVIYRVNPIGSNQPHHMTFTDRHGCLIIDIEIPVAYANEDDNDHFHGVEPVITDDIEIPGVDVAGPEALDEVLAAQVEIDDLDIPHYDPAPIEVVPSQTVPTSAPVAPPSLRRSAKVKAQATQG